MIELTLCIFTIMHPIGKCLVQIGIKKEPVLSDKNLNSDAHEYLIDYLRTKVDGECDEYHWTNNRNGFVHPYDKHSS